MVNSLQEAQAAHNRIHVDQRGKISAMLRYIGTMILRLILLLLLLTTVTIILPRLVTAWHARHKIFSVENAPTRPVAIVFGAGLWRDGTPTPVLRDRVAAATELYFAGKVEKLLFSGDNRFISYNEPGAMHTYAQQLGVPSEAIVLDYAGRRTYDTCYRARHIFGVKEAILVTQSFHLPRALYICDALGIPAVGVAGDRRTYRPRSLVYWNLREVPATLAAMWEVYIARPLPVLGDPEPIFPLEVE
jgi:SanA protein